ncbi:MAG: HAD family phosphatase [Chloroflexi bacterium]|nr:MAG: HAD family phosphatase [Chloroflexota bacterium]
MGLRYRAVIFDLDGVLWDGEPLYHEAFNIVLEPLGHRVSDEDYVNVIGHGVEEAWEWMRERFQLKDAPRRFLQSYDTAVLRLLARPLQPLPGVAPLIEELKRRGVALGVASSSLRQWVDATLRGLGLDSTFGAVVSASEVQHSKPAPDVYLLTAHRLGVNPTACLALEDTATGIAAAKAAGMFALQVRAASTALPPLPNADLVIQDYSQFDLSLLDGAVSGR